MSYSLRITPSARADRDGAIEWYEQQSTGLADRFIEEFFATARRIQKFPFSAPVLRGDARRVNLHRFPYQLWYRVDEKAAAIVVIAVLHHKRDSTDYGDLID